MLRKKVQDALNEQINKELYSAYLYLSMSAYCESINLSGFGHWMRAQAREEQEHAMKLYGFICDRGGIVELQAIDQPPVEFNSAIDLFEQTLKHEEFVTSLINDLYVLSVQEKDYATQIFLQWFVTEQVEEEKGAGEILERLRMIGDKAQGLLIMDRQLAAR